MSGDDEQMLLAYRHDEHKTRGSSHAAGATTINGVPVNEDVPWGVDGTASRMSRPQLPEGPVQVMEADGETHYRRSLVTGGSTYDPDGVSDRHLRADLNRLFTIGDAEGLHRAWLDSDEVAMFNEDWHYPFTSLKYHTLLVAALLDAHRHGHGYDDLYLHVTDDVIPHRTIFDAGDWALTIGPDGETPSAKLSSSPFRNWASVWGRLAEHPLDGTDRVEMVLDAQLRRIRAWSTALQYIEDYRAQGWVE